LLIEGTCADAKSCANTRSSANATGAIDGSGSQKGSKRVQRLHNHTNPSWHYLVKRIKFGEVHCAQHFCLQQREGGDKSKDAKSQQGKRGIAPFVADNSDLQDMPMCMESFTKIQVAVGSNAILKKPGISRQASGWPRPMSPKDLTFFFFSSLDLLEQVLYKLAALQLQRLIFLFEKAHVDRTILKFFYCALAVKGPHP
jgi:hypothetical protein